MWLVAWAIFALRCILAPLALVLLWLSRSGPVALWQGNASLTQHNRAQMFFFALAVVLSQTFFLLAPTPPLLLLSLLLTGTSLALAVHYFARKRKLGLGDIDALVDHPHLSMPLVQLRELDPLTAEQLAQEARHRLAERKAGR